MPNTRDIKRRQRSVKNTGQVTKAMQMVAASKMRKSQLVTLQSRPYAEKAISVLTHIKQRQPDIQNIFLNGPSLKRSEEVKPLQTLALIVTSDKGLCGGLNSSVLKECANISEAELILVGTKSKSHFEKLGLPILEVFKGAGDYVELEQVKPIAAFIREKYKTGDYSKVIAVYTEFISTLKQKVTRRQILPITPYDPLPSTAAEGLPLRKGENNSPPYEGGAWGGSEYIFEPSPEALLDTLIPFLLDIHIYHIILESNASEHSARMVAMKNATDNAERMLGELTLSYNKARQSGITREITEITAGVEALK